MDREMHALLIAEAAHYGQFDKGGRPRFEHVRYVGDRFTESIYRIVGFLHDTLEDSPLTSRSALAEIFGETVSDAVWAITRQGGEKYFDYIERCKQNSIAREVKIQDILHNMDKSRWPEMPESYEKREVKALAMLRYE